MNDLCHSVKAGSVVGTLKSYLMQKKLFELFALTGGRDAKTLGNCVKLSPTFLIFNPPFKARNLFKSYKQKGKKETRIHSSRMRTAHSLTISRSIRWEGVYPTPNPPGCRTPLLDADPPPGCRPFPPLREQNDRQV